MGILTDEMKRLVREAVLGFQATVNGDGSPNLSPKGTTAVWDDDQLFFADIRSPQTVANIRRGSGVEVNVVDQFVRKGYRFKGHCGGLRTWSGRLRRGYRTSREEGFETSEERINAIVVIEVRDASPLISPAYDDGTRTEAEIVIAWQERFARLHPKG